jgi:hypothetical protein
MEEKSIAALKTYFKSLKQLEVSGVLINKHSFTCQLGEWLVASIYDGQRAVNANQKGWDVKAGDTYIQVKAHAKATTNPARYSVISKLESIKVDELIIVVFTEDYKLKHFYRLPWQIAFSLAQKRTKQERLELDWSKLATYSIPIHTLPKQNIISLFL